MGAMVYTHGTLTISQIKDMLGDKSYCVYAVTDQDKEPLDWDWQRDGFWHGITKEVESLEEVYTALSEGKDICYELTDEYFKHHAYAGEAISFVRETYYYEYTSLESNNTYRITTCSYLGKEPKYPSYELYVKTASEVCGCTYGTWERDDEGYEFKSVGSRMFDIPESDISEIFKALKKADSWLKKKFKTEEKD